MSDEKKPVKLIVSDIDNTISDYFNNWGMAWDKGVEELAKSRGLEKDKLYDSIRDNAEGYARFHNFPDIIKETPELSYEGKSAEERAFTKLLKGEWINAYNKYKRICQPVACYCNHNNAICTVNSFCRLSASGNKQKYYEANGRSYILLRISLERRRNIRLLLLSHL